MKQKKRLQTKGIFEIVLIFLLTVFLIVSFFDLMKMEIIFSELSDVLIESNNFYDFIINIRLEILQITIIIMGVLLLYSQNQRNNGKNVLRGDD